jgi:hypothetical protein
MMKRLMPLVAMMLLALTACEEKKTEAPATPPAAEAPKPAEGEAKPAEAPADKPAEGGAAPAEGGEAKPADAAPETQPAQ